MSPQSRIIGTNGEPRVSRGEANYLNVLFSSGIKHDRSVGKYSPVFSHEEQYDTLCLRLYCSCSCSSLCTQWNCRCADVHGDELLPVHDLVSVQDMDPPSSPHADYLYHLQACCMVHSISIDLYNV